MNEKTYSLKCDDRIIEYSVSRSRKRRKTMAILIHPERGVVVMVPYKTTDGQLSAFVDSKRQWIAKKLPVVEGVTSPPSLFDDIQPSWLRNSLKRWFVRRADEELNRVAAEMVERTGLKPDKIVIKKLNASWGRCRGDTISLSRRLFLAPDRLIEYVVVHELCHLEHKNHSKDFWTAVGAIMPDYKLRRKQLRELGPRLPRF